MKNAKTSKAKKRNMNMTAQCVPLCTCANFAPWSPSDKGHYIADVLPWFIWGNSSEDNTTVLQRINSYRKPFLKEK